jgi:predicted alpha/beta-fold hydrolase
MASVTTEPLVWRARYIWRVFLLSLSGLFVFLWVAVTSRAGKGTVAKASRRPDVSEFDDVTVEGCTAADAARVTPSRISTAVAFIADLTTYVSEIEGTTRARVPLPLGFREEQVEINGIRMGVTIGEHQDGPSRTAVVLIPGMFNSRVQNIMIRAARAAYFGEGLDVVIPDLRGFGETGRLNVAPPSGSWKEASDIAALCRWVRERLSSRAVFVSGFSYGASVALSAAVQAEAGVIDLCFAFSPFGEARSIIERLSSPLPLLDPFVPFQLFFGYLLRRHCHRRNNGSCTTFVEHFERHIAPWYGVSAEELYRRASPVEELSRITIPTMIVYALDDPIIPVSDALLVHRRARNNPAIRVVFQRRGGHFGRAMFLRCATLLHEMKA